MQTIVQAALAKTEPPRLEGIFTTLFLVRLVSYPWLMHTLAATAATDPQWQIKGRNLSPRTCMPMSSGH